MRNSRGPVAHGSKLDGWWARTSTLLHLKFHAIVCGKVQNRRAPNLHIKHCTYNTKPKPRPLGPRSTVPIYLSLGWQNLDSGDVFLRLKCLSQEEPRVGHAYFSQLYESSNMSYKRHFHFQPKKKRELQKIFQILYLGKLKALNTRGFFLGTMKTTSKHKGPFFVVFSYSQLKKYRQLF